MRSLEEVRADLARLRQNARERHAQLQVQRQASAFAPTDFMDYKKAPEAAPSEPVPLLPIPSSSAGSSSDFSLGSPEAEDGSDTSFAATAFLDFSTLKSKPGR